MILQENEFSHLKGVSKQPDLTIQLETVKPMHHIWSKDSYFPVFHCSTKNSTMFSSSFLFLQLPFLHSSNRPFTNFQLPLCQDESKCETIHMTSTYRFIRTKTRFETDAQTSIHPRAAHWGLWSIFGFYILFPAASASCFWFLFCFACLIFRLYYRRIFH